MIFVPLTSHLSSLQALSSTDHISITPWLTNLGLQNCFISAAFIGLASSSVFLVMIYFGKRFREAKRDKYWALVNDEWRAPR